MAKKKKPALVEAEQQVTTAEAMLQNARAGAEAAQTLLDRLTWAVKHWEALTSDQQDGLRELILADHECDHSNCGCC